MMSRVKVNVQDVRRAETPPPDSPTMRYLGHDKHSEKIITGKFGSNVAPRNAGKGKTRPTHWVCVECNHENRDYHATCFKCNARTRPF
jgi:hypothetical protein